MFPNYYLAPFFSSDDEEKRFMYSNFQQKVVNIIVKSLINKNPINLTVSISNLSQLYSIQVQLRLAVILLSRLTGGISATITPSFKKTTYPIMFSLINGLRKVGLESELSSKYGYTVEVSRAVYTFFSMDKILTSDRYNPDFFLEVFNAHMISPECYEKFESLSNPKNSLTRVFFGLDGYHDSLFELEKTHNLSGRLGGVHIPNAELDELCVA
jgi:hypothetical protein|tara:strand:- start:1537 stop:2175 length:639 start_codon:yes stop_codon:yes gene_type:complete